MPPAYSRTAARLAALTIALAALVACDTSKGSLLAPTDSVITLSSSASLLPVNGTTSISVSVRQSNGAPVDDGTEVLLSASRGALNEIKMRTRGGIVVATYRAASEAGTARIEASSAGARSTLELAVTSGIPERVKAAASPATLPPIGGTADITATVTDSSGSPVAGAPVTFTTTAGTLEPTGPVTTDQSGIARTKVKTTSSVTVAARVHTSAASEVRITVKDPVTLKVAADPETLSVGESTTFTITPSDLSVSGSMSMNFGNGSTADLGQTKGKVTKAHVYTTAGGFNATAIFKPANSPEVRETVRITVSTVPVELRLEADPDTLEEGDETTFTITPTNSTVSGEMSMNFGDGSSANLGHTTGKVKKTHTYKTPGGYNATAIFVPTGSPEIRQTVRITVTETSDPPPTDPGPDEPPPSPDPPDDPKPPKPPKGIPGDDIDLRTVNFLHADVSDWDVTAELTDVGLSLPPLCLEYTGKNEWPEAGGTVGNPWVFAKIDGEWYGGTWEWFEAGQTCKKGIGPEGPGRLVKKSPLKEWHPQHGELVGFMVSTHARDKFRGPKQERTNVVLVRWP